MHYYDGDYYVNENVFPHTQLANSFACPAYFLHLQVLYQIINLYSQVGLQHTRKVANKIR